MTHMWITTSPVTFSLFFTSIHLQGATRLSVGEIFST